MTRIYTDADIERVPFRIVLEAVRKFVLEDYEGKTVAPPRHIVEFGDGALCFTTGGNASFAGFRAYETFSGPVLAHENQLVALWDRASRRLSAIAIGERLGALRTGALGGIAIDRMAALDASVLAVIGTGLQAETQLIAAAEVRKFSDVRVFSRNARNCAAFAARIAERTGLHIASADGAQTAVRDADVVILATNSETPVVNTSWLKPRAHINTVGPKKAGARELPLEAADQCALIASDSPQQILDMGDAHMLAGRPAAARILHLGDPNLTHSGGASLYLSAGLAGTEVAALAAAAEWLGA